MKKFLIISAIVVLLFAIPSCLILGWVGSRAIMYFNQDQPTVELGSGYKAEKPEVEFADSVPDCFPVNGPWLEAFANGQTYEFDPRSEVFDQSSFNYFEGVLVGSDPSDLHSVFEMKETFEAEQGNAWTCGYDVSDVQKHTILFQSADKKWQNLESQELAHPMKVTTPEGTFEYASGEQPAWALGTDDTNLVCPFTKPERSDPAGVIENGSFVGAPGKAGCDFVAVYPDGEAVRYEGAIDNFSYPAGTHFFLFDPSWSNEEVAEVINVAVITGP